MGPDYTHTAGARDVVNISDKAYMRPPELVLLFSGAPKAAEQSEAKSKPAQQQLQQGRDEELEVTLGEAYNRQVARAVDSINQQAAAARKARAKRKRARRSWRRGTAKASLTQTLGRRGSTQQRPSSARNSLAATAPQPTLRPRRQRTSTVSDTTPIRIPVRPRSQQSATPRQRPWSARARTQGSSTNNKPRGAGQRPRSAASASHHVRAMTYDTISLTHTASSTGDPSLHSRQRAPSRATTVGFSDLLSEEQSPPRVAPEVVQPPPSHSLIDAVTELLRRRKADVSAVHGAGGDGDSDAGALRQQAARLVAMLPTESVEARVARLHKSRFAALAIQRFARRVLQPRPTVGKRRVTAVDVSPGPGSYPHAAQGFDATRPRETTGGALTYSHTSPRPQLGGKVEILRDVDGACLPKVRQCQCAWYV